MRLTDNWRCNKNGSSWQKSPPYKICWPTWGFLSWSQTTKNAEKLRVASLSGWHHSGAVCQGPRSCKPNLGGLCTWRIWMWWFWRSWPYWGVGRSLWSSYCHRGAARLWHGSSSCRTPCLHQRVLWRHQTRRVFSYISQIFCTIAPWPSMQIVIEPESFPLSILESLLARGQSFCEAASACLPLFFVPRSHIKAVFTGSLCHFFSDRM